MIGIIKNQDSLAGIAAISLKNTNQCFPFAMDRHFPDIQDLFLQHLPNAKQVIKNHRAYVPPLSSP